MNREEREGTTDGAAPGPPESPPAWATLGQNMGTPPPYTDDTDNFLPSYEDLPQKKVDLPPYQEEHPGEESFMRTHHVRDLMAAADQLGTDSVFILCFLICFLFNWLGYIICFCLFTSVAARCGAISGIGLNLVKLLLILKRCTFDNPQMIQAQQYMQIHEIQYMLLMTLGLLVLVFGILRYNSAKSAVRRTLLLPRYM